jgi:hypothetical protein
VRGLWRRMHGSGGKRGGRRMFMLSGKISFGAHFSSCNKEFASLAD